MGWDGRSIVALRRKKEAFNDWGMDGMSKKRQALMCGCDVLFNWCVHQRGLVGVRACPNGVAASGAVVEHSHEFAKGDGAAGGGTAIAIW